jgi:hypothetical protein
MYSVQLDEEGFDEGGLLGTDEGTDEGTLLGTTVGREDGVEDGMDVSSQVLLPPTVAHAQKRLEGG